MRVGAGVVLGLVAVALAVGLWMVPRAGESPTPSPSHQVAGTAGRAAAVSTAGAQPLAESVEEGARRPLAPAALERADRTGDAGGWEFRTLHADGTPAPGVRLAVWRGRDASRREPIWVGKTDRFATVRVEDLGARADPQPRMRFAVVAMVPAARPVARELDFASTPVAPVELILPPVGAVEVELVDRHDVPVPLTADLWVGARHAEPGDLMGGLLPEWCDRGQLRREANRGPIRFDPVALGTELTVFYALSPGSEAGPPGQLHVEAPWHWGPAALDGTPTIRAELDGRFAVATGRVVRAGGAPITSTGLKLSRISVVFPNTSVGTDDDGRFALLFHRHLHAKPFHLTLEFDAEGLRAGGPVQVSNWGEVFDLGDLVAVASPGAFGMSGRLLDGRGEPIAGTRVILEAPVDPDDHRGQRWRHLPPGESITDADGRFELRAWQAVDIVRARTLGTSRRDIGVSVPQPFGTAGAEIRVAGPAVGDVEVGFLVAEDAILDRLKAWLVPADGSDWRTRPCSIGGRPPHAVFRAVPAGRYRLVVGWMFERPLAVVDDVVVRAGERTDDPRLRAVVLGAPVFGYEVQLIDSTGRPLNGRDTACLLDVPDVGAPWGLRFSNDRARFSLPVPTVTAEFLRADRRARVALLKSGSSTVELEDVPIIPLSLAELRGFVGRGVAVRIFATPLDVRPPQRGDSYVRESPGPDRGLANWAFLDDDGVVELPAIRTGRYEIAASNAIHRCVIGTAELDVDSRTVRSFAPDDGWRESASLLRPSEPR